jgi:hypothetical protein
MEHMDIDAIIEETARDVAAEADKIAASEAAMDATVEAGGAFADEAAKTA